MVRLAWFAVLAVLSASMQTEVRAKEERAEVKVAEARAEVARTEVAIKTNTDWTCSELTEKKCRPCEGGVLPYTKAEAVRQAHCQHCTNILNFMMKL
jgi:hypothetical protein